MEDEMVAGVFGRARNYGCDALSNELLVEVIQCSTIKC